MLYDTKYSKQGRTSIFNFIGKKTPHKTRKSIFVTISDQTLFKKKTSLVKMEKLPELI